MEIRKLSDVANVFSGFAFKSSHLGQTGFPVIKIANIQDKRVLKECADHLPQELFTNRLERFVLKEEDILVAMTGAGSVGKFGKMHTVDNVFLVNQRVGIIRTHDSECDYRYLYYVLIQPYYEKYLYQLGVGAGQPNVSPAQVGNLQIPLPEIKKQQSIAAILSAYDDLIENNSHRIQVLEEMARRIYEEWFVRFRFPGHENVEMVESELGLIPEGWEVNRLDEVATINGLSVSRGREPAEILYVDIASVSAGRIDEARKISFREAPGRARRIVKHGDIIWSNVRPNRKSYALIINPPGNMIVSTGFTVVSAMSVPYSFLYQALTTEDFAKYLTNRAKGAAYPAVGSEDFCNARMIIPPRELLSSFDEMSRPIVLEKHVLVRKTEVLRRTRDLLVPKLVSGDVNVSHFPEPDTD